MPKIICNNPLSCEDDIKDFVLEGEVDISFSGGAMRLASKRPSSEGQKANFVLWCPKVFPADIMIEWEFRPIREPGLAMLFFAAKPKNGPGSIFDGALLRRTGEYEQYHSGDLNTYHLSYFRRKEPSERGFHTCNLRKSYGGFLVSQGADPIPDASENADWYNMRVVKRGSKVSFYINDLQIFDFYDDGMTFGDLLTGGNIGFRQLSPMVAEYRNLKVTWI
ncbi:YesU family protein [Butyrivibrio sp. DSM 10294]|uniref:DUF1961 family protein n=1 Tax=Butyrivibrio sp. DSM 10294 TaxID=2972457 RepID=UPI00234F3A15|nr:DUF1961 family protein [Butyrivibrio sp. DSM 10294]MDC7294692.1 YesU family protein [Butyrivibrio sp. DSM 10294]